MDKLSVKFVEFCKNYKEDKVDTTFTNDPEIDAKIFNIKKYPHLFVLSCLMDKQIKAERVCGRFPILYVQNCVVEIFHFHLLPNLLLNR